MNPPEHTPDRTCPTCRTWTEPHREARVPGGYEADYICGACGEVWTEAYWNPLTWRSN